MTGKGLVFNGRHLGGRWYQLSIDQTVSSVTNGAVTESFPVPTAFRCFGTGIYNNAGFPQGAFGFDLVGRRLGISAYYTSQISLQGSMVFLAAE